jgi:hypothetical protein
MDRKNVCFSLLGYQMVDCEYVNNDDMMKMRVISINIRL